MELFNNSKIDNAGKERMLQIFVAKYGRLL
jgi:hypothetical protein